MRKRLAGTVSFAIFVTVFALMLILFGSATLMNGRLHYGNYWGGAVFAPFAIGMGVLLLAALPFLLRGWNRRAPDLRGKAARLERKAKETRFPIDDFHKPWSP